MSIEANHPRTQHGEKTDGSSVAYRVEGSSSLVSSLTSKLCDFL